MKETAYGPAARLSLYWLRCHWKWYSILWKSIIIPFADVLGLYKLQHKTVLCYIHTLQSQVPSADVLGMCKLPGIILCYTYILQSQIPFTHVLGLGNLQNKIILCYTHTISFLMAISFPVLASTIQHVSVKLLELHHDDAEKTVHWNAHEYFVGQNDYKLKIKKIGLWITKCHQQVKRKT
jgi:hypothetical protein